MVPLFPAEAFILWSTTDISFRDKKCALPHKEATSSSMFLKLEFKGKKTDTGEHTMEHNHHFNISVGTLNFNPALLDTNMLLGTSKSS